MTKPKIVSNNYKWLFYQNNFVLLSRRLSAYNMTEFGGIKMGLIMGAFTWMGLNERGEIQMIDKLDQILDVLQ